jgi:cytochrome P450
VPDPAARSDVDLDRSAMRSTEHAPPPARLLAAADVGLDEIDVGSEFAKVAAGRAGHDLHAALRELRERRAVYDGDAIVDVLGAGVSVSGFSGRRVVTILRWDDCMAVLRDREHFSSAIFSESSGVAFGRTIFELDGDEHARLRSVVQRAFTPRGIEHFERSVFRPAVASAVDRLRGRDRADLYSDFTVGFPARTIFDMCQLPEDLYHVFMRAAMALLLVRTHPVAAGQASTRLGEMLGAQVIARRAGPPSGDLVSILAHASGGGTITDDEAVSFLRLLLPAGAETTSHASASLLWFLLHDRELLERIAADRSLVPAAIEESIRLEPALPWTHRLVTKDVTIGGVDIPAGSGLQLALGSANRDGSRWHDADRFVLDRPAQPNMSFGVGAHACLGAALARRQMALAVTLLLDQFPNVRLDPDGAPSSVTGVTFRGPTSVPALLG